MSVYETWDEEELRMAENIATALMVAAVTVVIIGVAAAWQAISLTSKAVQAVRHTP